MESAKTWKDLIPDLLLTFSTSLTDYSRDKIHILVLEGITDEEFYWQLFQKSFFHLENGKKIIFNTSKKKILYDDIAHDFNKFFAKSEPYKYKAFRNELNNVDKSDYMAYRFVTECIRYYENNPSLFKKFDLYGLIDKDFGHSEDTEGLKNLSSTKYHDRETSLVRCYLPNYIKAISNDENTIKQISNVLDFCFKQGILEDVSHKYTEMYGENKFLNKITHHYFKDNAKLIDSANTQFDFNYYLSHLTDYFPNAESFLLESEKYEQFKLDFISSLKKNYEFENELPNIVKRWLVDDESIDSDKKRIDRIFKYSNGHLLLNQIIKCTGNISGCKSEEDFMQKLLEGVVFVDKMYVKLFESLPLKAYKEHRLKNKFYEVL